MKQFRLYQNRYKLSALQLNLEYPVQSWVKICVLKYRFSVFLMTQNLLM